jgi:hypothetical protein
VVHGSSLCLQRLAGLQRAARLALFSFSGGVHAESWRRPVTGVVPLGVGVASSLRFGSASMPAARSTAGDGAPKGRYPPGEPAGSRANIDDSLFRRPR